MAEIESKVENVPDIKPSKVKQINEEKASQLKRMCLCLYLIC